MKRRSLFPHESRLSQGLTEDRATLRIALRLLQAVDAKVQMGQKLYDEDGQTKDKSELVLI